jgi:uncharacterized protein YbjT (DUF2867 family)
MNVDAQRILVIGGTGMLGRPVARRLKADGYNVRLLARSAEKARALLGEGYEVLQGDVEDSASLRRALAGVDGVHISLKGGPRPADYERMDHMATHNIAAAAKEAGIGRVTLLSAYAVSAEKADSPESRSKLKGETALKASGVPYTIFRCSWFMESLPLFVQGKSLTLIGKQAHPLHWVAAEDFAGMVSRSYWFSETLNTELSVYGPEAYTMREALERYAAADARGLKVTQISTRMLALLGMLTFNAEWRGTATLMRHYERWGEDGSPDEANRLLGAPATRLQEWLESR